ncbi:hypothetical protein F511_36348 [Dorcoceras hygrometricum]|uniref:Uncharacterized protein n=1 Tax=Dorcoceras hygrometricum TaxID=472368 RepID=A0A2Z7D849_9LAMI|nr:hypothetical protein F511_36348 [Dorcoceras hygrometricum]
MMNSRRICPADGLKDKVQQLVWFIIVIGSWISNGDVQTDEERSAGAKGPAGTEAKKSRKLELERESSAGALSVDDISSDVITIQQEATVISSDITTSSTFSRKLKLSAVVKRSTREKKRRTGRSISRALQCNQQLSRATVDPVASFSAITYPVVGKSSRKYFTTNDWTTSCKNIQPFNAINAQDGKNQWLR